MRDYISNPQDIERLSHQIIRQETDLAGFSTDEQQVAMRLVHTCGDTHIVDNLRISPHAIEIGCRALANNAPLLCDVTMVSSGISTQFYSGAIHCFINDPVTIQRGQEQGETRSMAAIDSWRPLIKDAVIAIGNAPTALFRLLEILDEIQDKPALIVAMPVGFVGAEESKAALWDNTAKIGVPVITLLGRRGGSALTAAAINALTRLNHNIRF